MKALIFPRSSWRSSSTPSPVSALVRSGVNLKKPPGVVQIRFVDADDGLAAAVGGDGRDPVNEKRIRDRICAGGKHDDLVNVRHGGTDEAVAPGQHLLHAALALALRQDLHPVAHALQVNTPSGMLTV